MAHGRTRYESRRSRDNRRTSGSAPSGTDRCCVSGPPRLEAAGSEAAAAAVARVGARPQRQRDVRRGRRDGDAADRSRLPLGDGEQRIDRQLRDLARPLSAGLGTRGAAARPRCRHPGRRGSRRQLARRFRSRPTRRHPRPELASEAASGSVRCGVYGPVPRRWIRVPTVRSNSRRRLEFREGRWQASSTFRAAKRRPTRS